MCFDSHKKEHNSKMSSCPKCQLHQSKLQYVQYCSLLHVATLKIQLKFTVNKSIVQDPPNWYSKQMRDQNIFTVYTLFIHGKLTNYSIHIVRCVEVSQAVNSKSDCYITSTIIVLTCMQ